MQTFSRTYMSKMLLRDDAFILLSMGPVLVETLTKISITQVKDSSEWGVLGIYIKSGDFFAFVEQQKCA